MFSFAAALVDGGDDKRTGEGAGEGFSVPFQALGGGVAEHAAAFKVNRGTRRAGSGFHLYDTSAAGEKSQYDYEGYT